MNNRGKIIEVENLVKKFGDFEANKNLTFDVCRGEIFGFLGANGAGKSTLMKAISGLVKYRGTISYNGNEIKHLNTSSIVKSGIVSIPEGRQLFKTMSVKDNIMLGAYLRYRRKDEVQESYRWVCSLFPIINSRSEQIAGTLSGGEQQMIAIARGLMSKPKLLLLDEPSLGLAPLFIKSLFQTIELLKSEGITILLVEQNAKMALSIADYCYLLTTGNVTFEGKPSEIMNNEKIKEAYLG